MNSTIEKGCETENLNWHNRIIALNDAVELFSGKWRFYILKTLASGPLRFKDLQKKTRISPKVLAHELQNLEQNLLVVRSVKKTKPITVEYSVTEYTREIRWVMEALITFGVNHRNKIKEQFKSSNK